MGYQRPPSQFKQTLQPRLSLTKYSCDRFPRVSLTNVQIFSQVLLNFFLRWLHLNNLCHESIAQDGMQVLQIFFTMATSK